MDNYKTEQEYFWGGTFGDEYTIRNNSDYMISSNTALFSQIITNTKGIKNVLEIGSNRGLNLLALSRLLPDMKMTAVEINKKAADECALIPNVEVINCSVFDYNVQELKYDLSFTKGVLIHIAPEKLEDVYDKLYRSSRRYVMVAEYYNPTPIEVLYRGNEGKLYKRDFAGEMMKKYDDLSLVNYGFVYHGDNNFACDDITWFLMEKK